MLSLPIVTNVCQSRASSFNNYLQVFVNFLLQQKYSCNKYFSSPCFSFLQLERYQNWFPFLIYQKFPTYVQCILVISIPTSSLQFSSTSLKIFCFPPKYVPCVYKPTKPNESCPCVRVWASSGVWSTYQRLLLSTERRLFIFSGAINCHQHLGQDTDLGDTPASILKLIFLKIISFILFI